jgi:hypothetical protein
MQNAFVQNELQTIEIAFESRPINTRKSYSGKQEEFKIWCRNQNFIDGETVSSSKLHQFLIEKVLNRNSKINSNAKIGKSSLMMYISSIVDLYQYQKAINMNNNEHPRNNLVKRLINMYAGQENERKKSAYVDRGIGTLLDGYTSFEELIKFADYFFQKNDFCSIRNKEIFFFFTSSCAGVKILEKCNFLICLYWKWKMKGLWNVLH